jgi:Caspase domain
MSIKSFWLLLGTGFILFVTTLLRADAQTKPLFYPGPEDARLAPRSALLLGVSIYKEPMFKHLPNPVNDVRKISESLEKLGFNVFPKRDPTPLTRQKFKQILYDYIRHLQKTGGTSLFYFAGHGLQHGDKAYLVPHDGIAYYGRDLREELIPLDLLSDAFAEMGKDILHIIILDSCRDFALPDLKNLGKSNFEKVTAGIRFDAPDNTFLATSADVGQRAKDGPLDGNSPYAIALAGFLPIPHEPIVTTFDRVALYFKELSIQDDGGDLAQTPVFTRKGGSAFYFAPNETTFQEEKKEWEKISMRPIVTANDYRLFLNAYPAGYFAGQARNGMKKLPPPLPPLGVRPGEKLIIAMAPKKMGPDSQFKMGPNIQFNMGPNSELMKGTREEFIRALYAPKSDTPPKTLQAFIDKMNASDIRSVSLIARAENEVDYNRVSTAISRLLRIQALLAARNINSALVKTTIAGPSDTVLFDEIDVMVTLVERR